MKISNIGATMMLTAATLMFNSCLDYDVTGAEFSQTETNVKKVTRQGEADKINYRANISAAELQKAVDAASEHLFTAQGGVYALYGGKDGSLPVEHAYQYQCSFGTDLFAQYGVIPHSNFPYSGGNLPSAYSMDMRYYGGNYGAFKKVATPIVPLLNVEEVDKMPEIKAVFLLLYDIAALQTTDIYGPMPYQDIKNNKQKHPYTYDSVETIYNTIVENIDSCVACFKHFDTKDKEYRDIIIGQLTMIAPLINFNQAGEYKDLKPFLRLANSIKLRMAMHIVKRDNATAKRWAEEAVASGVIETTNDEIALFPSILGIRHPNLVIWNSWNDMRLSAGYQQVLEAMDHPYIKKTPKAMSEDNPYVGSILFSYNERIVNSKDETKTLQPGVKVMGIRSGAHVGTDQGSTDNPYNGFSKLNMKYMEKAPLYIVKLSEVCFLRAEGAVRGWAMGGEPKKFYEDGIRYGDCQDRLKQQPEVKGIYDAAMEEYLQKTSATPFTYVDPTGDTEPEASKITIGVKWNDGDEPEVKLEKIITQKYIASFPSSFEPWVDLRRTGYPRLFNVLNPGDGDGSLKDGDVIRRLPFPDIDNQTVLKDVLETGVPALGAPDKQATRLWWDVEGVPNI